MGFTIDQRIEDLTNRAIDLQAEIGHLECEALALSGRIASLSVERDSCMARADDLRAVRNSFSPR